MTTNTALQVTAYGLLVATILCILSQTRTLIAISEVVDAVFMVSLLILGGVLLYRRGTK